MRTVPNHKLRGFTLIELMIVLVIAGVLAAIAAPNMREFVADNRLSTQTNDFIAAMSLARTTAITKQSVVTICATVGASQNDCNAAARWQQGWILFTDVDSDGTADLAVGGPAQCTPFVQDCIYKRYEGLGGGNKLLRVGFSNAKYIQFDRRGALAGAVGTFTLCDSRDVARVISINAIGRASSQVGVCDYAALP